MRKLTACALAILVGPCSQAADVAGYVLALQGKWSLQGQRAELLVGAPVVRGRAWWPPRRRPVTISWSSRPGRARCSWPVIATRGAPARARWSCRSRPTPISRVARCAPAERHPGTHRRRSRPLHRHTEPRIRRARRCGLAVVRGWRRPCTGVARPACRERPRDRPDDAAMPRARRLPATATDVTHRRRAVDDDPRPRTRTLRTRRPSTTRLDRAGARPRLDPVAASATTCPCRRNLPGRRRPRGTLGHGRRRRHQAGLSPCVARGARRRLTGGCEAAACRFKSARCLRPGVA